MCGIIAYLSQKKKNIYNILHAGLFMIQNRGYDSAGLCAIKNNQLHNRKYASKFGSSALKKLNQHLSEFDDCCLGIAHTRWATHGAKTDLNAHPHIDLYNQFALVHNGIIENYQTLKKFLVKQGYQFMSETDTEVIVNLISYHYMQKKDVNLAIQIAMNQLEGTWALAIICIHCPNDLYLCKNGSPLLLGFNQEEIIVASEIAGFCNYVNQYIILENHDIIKLNFDDFSQINFNRYKIHEIDTVEMVLSPEPYQHWMLKEIEEQPQSLMRSINNGGRIQSEIEVKLGGLEKSSDRLIKINNLLIIACGTSFHAGLYGSIWFKKLKIFNTVNIIDASEFGMDDLPHNDAGIIVISQSGETKDIQRAMELIKTTDLPIISIVNVVDSVIAREADCGVYLNAGREVGVASTKSFTSQCIVLVLIGIWFAQKKLCSQRSRKFLINSLNSVSYNCGQLIANQRQNCQNLAMKLINQTNCFILGRGLLYPIALEGALKLKEIGYIHAEGYCGGALKHGPFALIEKDTVIIILIDKETFTKMNSAIEEVKSRKATVIVISDHQIDNDRIDYLICINQTEKNYLHEVYYAVIFQLIAYYMAIYKGNDPDHPRNLAKVVTVDG